MKSKILPLTNARKPGNGVLYSCVGRLIYCATMRPALAFLIMLFAAGCGHKTQQSPSVAPPASPAAEAQATTGENPDSPPTASSTGDQVDRASASAPNGVANVASTKNASAAELAPVLSEL